MYKCNLYKATTKCCGLSRQVVSHDKENKHDFEKAVLDKWYILCVFINTFAVSLYRLHSIELRSGNTNQTRKQKCAVQSKCLKVSDN